MVFYENISVLRYLEFSYRYTFKMPTIMLTRKTSQHFRLLSRNYRFKSFIYLHFPVPYPPYTARPPIIIGELWIRSNALWGSLPEFRFFITEFFFVIFMIWFYYMQSPIIFFNKLSKHFVVFIFYCVYRTFFNFLLIIMKLWPVRYSNHPTSFKNCSI